MRKFLNIRDLRKHLNMTQQEFATAVGVTRITVTRWEGGMKPHPVFIQKIADLQFARPNGRKKA